jgi:hypothetical protein
MTSISFVRIKQTKRMASISFVTMATYRLAAAAVMTERRVDKGPTSKRNAIGLPCYKATVPVTSGGKECGNVVGFDIDESIVEHVSNSCKIGRKVSEVCGKPKLTYLPNVNFSSCDGSVYFIRDGSIRKML